jgi:FMN-dependent NADH-azoreductase
MKILHIDCSVRNERSTSRKLSKLFVDELKDKHHDLSVDYLDLAVDAPPHVSALFIEGNYSVPVERTPEMIRELAESETLIERMHDADVYVIGMPMYNFSVPSNFKAFIDNIVRIGRTFRANESGFEGMLLNKKVYVINTRGVDFNHEMVAPMDVLRPYLKTIFGFMDLYDVTFIDVHPVKWGDPERLARALAKAHKDIKDAVLSL